jgi:ketosteroid isomerase-like protein
VDQNVDVVLEAFSAIERRDDQRFLDLLHPDFEILWPPRFLMANRHQVETTRFQPGVKSGTRYNRVMQSEGWIRASSPIALTRS